MVLNNIRAWPRPLLGFCEKLTLSWLKLGQWLKSDEKDLTIYGFLWHVLCWCFLSIVASQGEVDNCWRSVDFNAGHSPSPLGWNPGHCYLANLCHVCERVILHNLQLKICWCIFSWQEYLAYQCSFFAGTFCVLITVVICVHAQVRLDIFLSSSIKIRPFPIQKKVWEIAISD